MLITRCPNCETTFRVRMEQLNLRGGRVRCGHCHVPFSALASLEELPEETATTQFNTPPSPVAAAELQEPPAPQPVEAGADDPIAPIDLPPTPPVLPRQRAEHADHAVAPATTYDTPGQDLDFDIEGASIESARQAGAQAAIAVHEDEAPPAEVAAEEPDKEFFELGSTEDDAAEFDREFEKNLGDDDNAINDIDMENGDSDGDGMPQLHTIFLDEDIPPGAAVNPAELAARARTRRILVLGNVLLLLTGLVLATYVFRVELTRLYPGLRAPLEQACRYFACDVPYPRDADEVLLVGSDLTQADKGASQGAYHLAVTVRNHARYPVAWPQLEITLTDRFERALTRRVLEPKEWLPADAAQRPAFEALGELTSQLNLSSDSQVVGYRLGVFYR